MSSFTEEWLLHFSSSFPCSLMKTASLPLSIHCRAQSGLLGRRSPFATLEAVHFSQANQPVSFVVSAGSFAAPTVSRATPQSLIAAVSFIFRGPPVCHLTVAGAFGLLL